MPETDTHDPESGMPVTFDADWYPVEMRRAWYCGELQDALRSLGWVSTSVDRDGEPLTRNHRWVSPDGTRGLRLPVDAARLVSPYLAACVVGAMTNA